MNLPRAPRTLEETGVPRSLLAELAAKALFLSGPQRLPELATRLRLPARIAEELVEQLRRERLCEVAPSAGTTLVYGLTDLGHVRAEDFLRACAYAGPAPVCLEDYAAQVRRQSMSEIVVRREDMARAFAGVVLREKLLDQLGAAMNSGRALFLYGPPGSGKTFIAERLARLLPGEAAIPYAVRLGSQIVQVFDSHSHRTVDDGVRAPDPFLEEAPDPRWVRCRRPVVTAGGELTLAMLELQFDARTRFYAAPAQLKANNGLFIVDDLGRQLVRPKDLMNRWIVPLDRKIDYLGLHTGEKFAVPFDVTVVFSTNLAPAELADESFLRRLGYKIYVGPLEEPQYRRLCAEVCERLGLRHSERAVDALLARQRAEARPLLACTPHDLLSQARDRARYCGRPPELSEELFDWAWANYFAAHGAASS
ncbi:MAG TPA: ATP-binding protein [Burkholderiales bacterium]|nr:ATP-binding protein [Burkholderiales bacterium]